MYVDVLEGQCKHLSSAGLAQSLKIFFNQMRNSRTASLSQVLKVLCQCIGKRQIEGKRKVEWKSTEKWYL